MLIMKETKKRGPGRPATRTKPKGSRPQLHTEMDQELRDAIEKFRTSQEFPPQLNDIGIKAFEEFLEKRGFWPHKPDAGCSGSK